MIKVNNFYHNNRNNIHSNIHNKNNNIFIIKIFIVAFYFLIVLSMHYFPAIGWSWLVVWGPNPTNLTSLMFVISTVSIVAMAFRHGTLGNRKRLLLFPAIGMSLGVCQSPCRISESKGLGWRFFERSDPKDKKYYPPLAWRKAFM